MLIRNAEFIEAVLCYSFIEEVGKFHAQMSFEKWHSDYPTLQTIEQDIAEGVGYVFLEDNQPVGCCCLVIGDKPAY